MGTIKSPSWDTLQLEQISWTTEDQQTHLEIKQMTLPNPFALIASKYLDISSPSLIIHNWNATIRKSKHSEETTTSSNPLETAKSSIKTLHKIIPWLPPISISKGTVDLPGSTRIRLKSLDWDRTSFRLHATAQTHEIKADMQHEIAIDVGMEGPWVRPHLTQFQVLGEGIDIELQRPVALDPKTAGMDSTTHILMQADLSGLHIPELSGHINLSMQIEPFTNTYPKVEVQGILSNLNYADNPVFNANLSVSLARPNLSISLSDGSLMDLPKKNENAEVIVLDESNGNQELPSPETQPLMSVQHHFTLNSQINLDSLEGEIDLEADEIDADMQEKFSQDEFSAVDTVAINLSFSPQGIELKRTRLQVEEEKLLARGKWPWGPEGWDKVFSGEIPDWTSASATIKLPQTPLRTIRPLLPKVIRPTGEISARIQLKPGKNLSGNLKLIKLSTRPLTDLGSVDDINADIFLKDDQILIEQLEVKIAENTLKVDGQIDIGDLNHPRWDIHVKGDNVPFMRKPGLIIRGSPDITIKTHRRGRTDVTGTVKLEQSFVLVDFASLASSNNEASPETRPPFFSVREPLFAKWKLNVKLAGKEFLRVRTPVFEAIISANFTLNGTLKEPFSYGQATINKGLIMFPFSTFKIQEGTLTINQDAPFEPQVSVIGTTTTYGYDLRLEVTGPPDDPQLIFTSTPALSSNDILLMVTSGKVPNDNVNQGTGNRLAGLGSFLGKSVLTDLGLIDPLDNRLEITVGEYVTEQGSETVKVEYRLSDEWAVIGSYDRFDSYNMDLKWTFYSD